MGMLKKLRKKGKNQSKDQPAADDNDAVVENEEVTEPAPKEEKKTADELVAAMFSKQNLDESKKRAEEVAAEMSSKPKQSADDRVAQMFAKSKSTNAKDTTVSQKLNADELVAGMRLSSKTVSTEEKKVSAIGKTTEKNKAIEALLQKQHHDPKGFIDSNKVSTKVESADGFAERKQIVEDMAQRKGANEKKITVDVSNENFGNKFSFAMRRDILESKAQGKKMPTPTNERQSGLL